MDVTGIAARAAYGAVFCLALPALLAAWARRLDGLGAVTWPVPFPAPAGALALVAGLSLVGVAMALLVSRGRGLPMNAFPTRVLVEGSVYGLFAHPIYVGFSVAALGAAILAGSPAGFWVVAPLAALGCAVLVVGYEGPAVAARLGDRAEPPLFGLPAEDGLDVPFRRRVAVLAMTLGTWAALYGTFSLAPGPAGGADWAFPFEHGAMPRAAWAPWAYTLGYLFCALPPLVLKDAGILRRFAVSAWIAIAVGFGTMLVLPGRHAPDLGLYEGASRRLLEANFAVDAPWLALPSFHVVWTVIACGALSARWPRLRWAWAACAAAIVASCLMTDAHAMPDVGAGALLGWAAWNHRTLWRRAVAATERLGNSLDAFTIGKVRVLSHAAWSFAAAAAGTFLTAWLTGPALAPAALAVVAVGVVSAGAWGYLLEGGGRLSRPFGYFGFLLGASIALIVGCVAWPGEGMRLAAAFCVGGSLAQAIGRGRCVVQGCCHGKPAGRAPGLRIHHPASRVTRMSAFACVPIHPTPLYSAVANLAVMACLSGLWSAGASAPMVAGGYLILAAMARFVEERFRGEPQTPVAGGLSVYQWLCIPIVAAGCVMTCIAGPEAGPAYGFSWLAMLVAPMAGAIAAVAMSVDFPGTGLPMSTLTVKDIGQAKPVGPAGR